MVKLSEIIRELERHAPLNLQESWDNSGLQIGHPRDEVKGVLTAVDVTPEVIAEAKSVGANLVLSHHPLLFKGLKSITGSTRTQRTVESAIRNNIAVYSSHTALDNAENGVSVMLARKTGLTPLKPLIGASSDNKTGTGVVCEVNGVAPQEILDSLRKVFKVIRHSNPEITPRIVKRVAICSGSGGSFVEDAIDEGCQMYITGDLRHHDFVDYSDRIFLVDCGHFETEKMTKEFFKDLLNKTFPDIPVYLSQSDKNPIEYLI